MEEIQLLIVVFVHKQFVKVSAFRNEDLSISQVIQTIFFYRHADALLYLSTVLFVLNSPNKYIFLSLLAANLLKIGFFSEQENIHKRFKGNQYFFQ